MKREDQKTQLPLVSTKERAVQFCFICDVKIALTWVLNHAGRQFTPLPFSIPVAVGLTPQVSNKHMFRALPPDFEP